MKVAKITSRSGTVPLNPAWYQAASGFVELGIALAPKTRAFLDHAARALGTLEVIRRWA